MVGTIHLEMSLAVLGCAGFAGQAYLTWRLVSM